MFHYPTVLLALFNKTNLRPLAFILFNHGYTYKGFFGWMDGWKDDLRFTAFSTVFQTYQDDEGLIMKGCVQWNPVYG